MAALARPEQEQGSVIAAIERSAARHRGLHALPPPDGSTEPLAEVLTDLADPEQPVDPAQYLGDLFGARPARPLLRRAVKLAALVCAVAAALALWRYTSLAGWSDAARPGAALDRLSSSGWVGPLVLGVFVPGSLMVFPVTVLVAATAAALGPWDGFFWAFTGCLLGASATYGVGRLVGREPLEMLAGRWLGKVARRLRRGGVVPIMVIRNVPIAPFRVVNVIAGAMGVRFRDFATGTALGMGPGIAVATVLGDRLRGVWDAPTAMQFGLLLLAVALWVAVALGLRVLSNRFGR